jgi:hypothetical protein
MPRYHRGANDWTWRATFPGGRLILYYGIAYDARAGQLGQDDATLISKLRAQAQVYAQLDPAHPVTMGIDLVTPIADALPQTGNTYIARVDPATIQHFANLAHQNNMLFYVDMQIMHSPIQQELSYVWPYLQQPWGELALDPEWDMFSKPLNGDGVTGVPPYDTGRMCAAEINWIIDRLSALVLSKHLPPKILIIHKFEEEVSPDWQNIKLKPGVQVVESIDGVGYMYDKIIKYNLFNSPQERIQYPGFKLFYFNPLVDAHFSDSPLMTPQQVLALNPPPLMIMYQ